MSSASLPKRRSNVEPYESAFDGSALWSDGRAYDANAPDGKEVGNLIGGTLQGSPHCATSGQLRKKHHSFMALDCEFVRHRAIFCAGRLVRIDRVDDCRR